MEGVEEAGGGNLAPHHVPEAAHSPHALDLLRFGQNLPHFLLRLDALEAKTNARDSQCSERAWQGRDSYPREYPQHVAVWVR